MLLFRLRLDLALCYGDDVTAWLHRLSESYLLVSHTDLYGKNPHFHAWIETKYQEITIRAKIKQLDETLIGNKRYSLSKCDPERQEEYKTYLFNLKRNNIPSFVSHNNVPNWKQYQEASSKLTDEYLNTKTNKYSKNDCITELLRNPQHRTFHSLYWEILNCSRKRGVVFSVNAIREIIIYVGHFDTTNPHLTNDTALSVLKIFYHDSTNNGSLSSQTRN